MPRPAKIWFHTHKRFWCTKLGGKIQYLAKGRKNRAAAVEAFDRLKEEVKLLGNGQFRTLTVAALVELFLAFVEANRKPRTYALYRQCLQRFVDGHADAKAHAVRAHDVDTWIAALRKQGLSETTLGLCVESLLACWNWAVRKGVLPRHDLRNVEKPTKRRRERFLTDDEFQRLLRATAPKRVPRFGPARQKRPSKGAVFRQVLIASDETAARPGELASLQWKHVDFARHVWILPDHKTRTTQRTPRPRIIPMTPVVEKLLRWRQAHCPPSPYCFTNVRNRPWTTNALICRMRRLREKAGLGPDIVLYTLRHRRATKLLMETGDLKSTSEVLGHTTVSVTERYLHVAVDHLVRFVRHASARDRRGGRPLDAAARAG